MDCGDFKKILSDPSTHPIEWIDAFFQLKKFRYDYKTDSIHESSESLSHATTVAQLRIAVLGFGTTEIKPYLSDALLLWKRDQSKIFLSHLRSRLAHQPPAFDPIALWVKASTGSSGPLDTAVIRHFVWQVKRKLFGLPVEHHMMPVLYGKTGGGKSVAVHKLLAAVQDISLSRDMSIFSDSFGKKQFSRNFVIFFDELSKSSTVDVNSLKNVITAPFIDWRSMRSEGTSSSPQNSTFIACSNDPVSERICDPTSARRFWQINCAERLDWEAINAIDYEMLWRSVDENSGCPLLPYLHDIQAVQHRDIRTKDLIEQWLETSCCPAPFHADSPSTNELFDHFKGWCVWQGVVAYPGLQKFARSLDAKSQALGWAVGPKHSNRGTVWAVQALASVRTSCNYL